MLDIEVVEAAGLLGTEKGGVSNPRADILLVDLGGRVIRTEGVKHTSVIKGTTNPVWNYKVSFGQRANLSAPVGGNMPTLRVQVCACVVGRPVLRLAVPAIAGFPSTTHTTCPLWRRSIVLLNSQ